MLERENKRERILESKVKELKLKLRAQEREAEQALKARHMGITLKSSSSKGKPACMHVPIVVFPFLVTNLAFENCSLENLSMTKLVARDRRTVPKIDCLLLLLHVRLLACCLFWCKPLLFGIKLNNQPIFI